MSRHAVFSDRWNDDLRMLQASAAEDEPERRRNRVVKKAKTPKKVDRQPVLLINQEHITRDGIKAKSHLIAIPDEMWPLGPYDTARILGNFPVSWSKRHPRVRLDPISDVIQGYEDYVVVWLAKHDWMSPEEATDRFKDCFPYRVQPRIDDEAPAERRATPATKQVAYLG